MKNLTEIIKEAGEKMFIIAAEGGRSRTHAPFSSGTSKTIPAHLLADNNALEDDYDE